MPSIRIDRDLNDEMYFVTLTIKNWYHIFDRHHRWNILADSLTYCQQHKGLKIFAYVFMINHIHFIFQAPDAAGFLRDFKKHIAKELYNNLLATEPNVAKLFEEKKGGFCMWKKTNMPKIIETDNYLLEKIDYIHNNPVRKEYVREAEHWYWSSAGLYMDDEQGPIEVESEYVDLLRM